MKINLQFSNIKNNIPKKKCFIKWLYFLFYNKKIELTIRIVTVKEIIFLNHTYRKKNMATNVLSFPMNMTKPKKKHKEIYLGDIAICSSYLVKEALQLKKNLKEHWAHIVIHAGLHLMNHTHDTLITQKKMETIEKKIMKKLGYKNPY